MNSNGYCDVCNRPGRLFRVEGDRLCARCAKAFSWE